MDLTTSFTPASGHLPSRSSRGEERRYLRGHRLAPRVLRQLWLRGRRGEPTDHEGRGTGALSAGVPPRALRSGRSPRLVLSPSPPTCGSFRASAGRYDLGSPAASRVPWRSCGRVRPGCCDDSHRWRQRPHAATSFRCEIRAVHRGRPGRKRRASQRTARARSRRASRPRRRCRASRASRPAGRARSSRSCGSPRPAGRPRTKRGSSRK